MKSKLDEERIAIIGAGITGLSLAYLLCKAGKQVTLFEAKDKAGGFLDSIDTGGTAVEKYYHHILGNFNTLIEFSKELGLADNIVWNTAKMGFLYQGRVFPFNGIFDLLSFTPLTFLERLRLGFGILRLSRFADWQKMDSFSADEILRKEFGGKIYEKIWKPLLRMKFSDAFDRVSAVWIEERIRTRRSSRKASKSQESLGYIKGGFLKLTQKLSESIIARGGEILLSSGVSDIVFENNSSVKLRYPQGERLFSRVISTIALPCLNELLPSLSQQERQYINKVEYQHVLCVFFRLKKTLNKFYWINLVDDNIPFGVAIEHTNFINQDEYSGESIVYLVRYCPAGDVFFTEEEGLLREKGIAALKTINSNFNQEDIINVDVFRDKFAQPVFVKGYASIKAELDRPIRRLILADSSRLYPGSRSINSAISLSRQIAQDLTLN